MVRLDRDRVVAGVRWVLVPALVWRATVTVFWLDLYIDAPLSLTHPASGYLIGSLLADVDEMCALLAGGLVGGAALGAVANTARRATHAWTVAACGDVLLAWGTTPGQTNANSPLTASVLGGLLVVATACGAAVGLAARRHPAGQSCLAFLLAAVVTGSPHRLLFLSLRDGDVSPGSFAYAVGEVLLLPVLFLPPVLVAIAVAVAVRVLAPLPAAVTVASGLIGYWGVQALLVGAASGPHRSGEGTDLDTAHGWYLVAQSIMRGAGDWLAVISRYPDDPRIVLGLIGFLVGLASGIMLRQGIEYAWEDPNPDVLPARGWSADHHSEQQPG